MIERKEVREEVVYRDSLHQRINDCRKEFMAKIKEGVKTEVNAKKMLFFQWEEEKKQN